MSYSITGTTTLTGLLGHPVSHSISPLMHNEAFRLLNLDYVYLCFDVGCETLKTAVEGLKALGVRGFNLTMPDKTLMCELADELTPAARLSHSVNTVIHENGRLIGHSTDGAGYMRAVSDAGYDIIGKEITLLGAGGAGSAICVQAALDGVSKIHVFKRNNASYKKTQEFIDRINRDTSCEVTLDDIADQSTLKQRIQDSFMLINSTSVGMAPDVDSCLFPDASFFHPDLIVSDVIYNPRRTKLMELADQAGCKNFNGMYMLLYQGAESFACWTKKEMPTETIKQKFFT